MIIRNPQSTRHHAKKADVSCKTFHGIFVQDTILWKSLLFYGSKESKIRFLQISKKAPQLLSSHADLSPEAQSCLLEGAGVLKTLTLTLHERGEGHPLSPCPRNPDPALLMATH